MDFRYAKTIKYVIAGQTNVAMLIVRFFLISLVLLRLKVQEILNQQDRTHKYGIAGVANVACLIV